VSESIRIQALIPEPLPDLRRVSLFLRVTGLPAYGPAMGSSPIEFGDMPPAQAEAHQAPPVANVELFPEGGAAGTSDLLPEGNERPPSPYPDLTLCILDQDGNELASTYIVEHKEEELDFTLHLRSFEPGATYIARAQMESNDQVFQTFQVPFELVPGRGNTS
jgi:hypothetical protein